MPITTQGHCNCHVCRRHREHRVRRGRVLGAGQPGPRAGQGGEGRCHRRSRPCVRCLPPRSVADAVSAGQNILLIVNSKASPEILGYGVNKQDLMGKWEGGEGELG